MHYQLIYASSYTEYTAGQYPDLESCKEACVTRYGLRNPVFGQDDAGDLYTVTFCEDQVVVLKLHEVRQ